MCAFRPEEFSENTIFIPLFCEVWLRRYFLRVFTRLAWTICETGKKKKKIQTCSLKYFPCHCPGWCGFLFSLAFFPVLNLLPVFSPAFLLLRIQFLKMHFWDFSLSILCQKDPHVYDTFDFIFYNFMRWKIGFCEVSVVLAL